MQECRAGMQGRNEGMRECGSAGMRECGNAGMQAYRRAPEQLSVSDFMELSTDIAPLPKPPLRVDRMKVLVASRGRLTTFLQKVVQVPLPYKNCSTFEA